MFSAAITLNSDNLLLPSLTLPPALRSSPNPPNRPSPISPASSSSPLIALTLSVSDACRIQSLSSLLNAAFPPGEPSMPPPALRCPTGLRGVEVTTCAREEKEGSPVLKMSSWLSSPELREADEAVDGA